MILKITKKYWYILAASVVMAIALVAYFTTSSKATKYIDDYVDPAYGAYVSSYSAGVLSANSSIQVRLASPVADSTQIGQPAEDNLFKFNPGIAGTAFWLDTRTIEFKPDNLLPSDQQFEVIFRLSKVLEVPSELKNFEFYFQTIKQNFDVAVDNITTVPDTELREQKIEGTLLSADYCKSEGVEKILSASQEGNPLKIIWLHQPDGKSHNFIIEKVARKEEAGQVVLKWNGESIGVSKKGDREVEIPALGDFKLTNAKVVQNPEQYVSLQFSDPLRTNQYLNGLVSIKGISDLRFIIEQNEIKAYPPVRVAGSKEVSISPGLKNILGYELKKEIKVEVAFEQLKPTVRLVGKGVILPSTDGLIFPFEAVSLNAVDVTIVKIFEDNISQFLQVNQLDGNREVRRVGRPLIRKKVPLNTSGVTDLGKWNRFTLDLAEHIKTEPGAIYQIELNFRKSYSAYYCEGESQQEDMESVGQEENWDDAPAEDSYWDYYEDYYYDPNYDWNERDNPCHTSYYGRQRKVTRNVLASDLGLTAKMGGNGKMHIAVNDLKTTEPLSGVQLDIYNYQQQLLATESTNQDGMAQIDLTYKPYLLVASHNEQKGYLRLDNGTSLSVSNFNVGGDRVQEGIKGYIYGERGVWRPGDSLHLTFVLEDPEKLLPENHPVIFELLNSKNQVVKRMIRNNSVKGMYNFSTFTESEAETGNWQARIKVGGATFYKPLKIEAIKPNRLKINLDFGVDKLSVLDNDVSGLLSVKWLHGAIARNLKAEFEVVLTKASTQFKNFENYLFDDASLDFVPESQQIFDGKLDDKGEATINAVIDVDGTAPGVLTAHFKGKVFEEGGDFSIDRFSIPYYPYRTYVGLIAPEGDKARGMLLTDTLHTALVASVDANGKPVTRSGIQMELYKLDWRWWWDQSSDNISNYVSSSYHKPMASGRINTGSDGKGSWQFKVFYPEWGRFYLRACDPVSGHCTGKIIYMDWPGWAGRGKKEMPGGATMLSFSADKDQYNVGEQVTINIPGSSNGRALVSLETGSSVLQQYWVETQNGDTPFSFNATEDMSPNVYVNISLLQPHSQTGNDLPIRMYGVIPLRIDNPATHLKPEIEMPDELEPGQKVEMVVSEANGKPMAYTISVVDEGLLDLTRFPTPDPWPVFYAKEALGVRTWDLYDDVMGAFGGELERILAIGGDDMLNAPEDSKANRFKPVVVHLGPFYSNGGKKRHTFTMPQYVGSVRTMVVAAHEGAYGNAEKTTPVRQDLMVLGTLPRVLGPGEKVKLPVNLFVLNQDTQNAKVSITTNNLLSVSGSAEKTVSLRGEDQIVFFDLAVKPGLGVGKVTINAQAGNTKASHEIEIQVRNPNPPIVKTQEKVLAAGQSWNAELIPVGLAGTNSGVLEISSVPPINFGRRMKYLLGYPHGCIEQTTSQAFPQLFLADVMDLNQEEKFRTENNVKTALASLQKFQADDGGFAYWPGDREGHDWATNYAGHFMLEAEAKGYRLPDGVYQPWRRYQKRQANNWRPNSRYNRDDLIQAYRLYTLAMAKAPELGAMNRMREMKDLSVTARWRLAAAYALAGQKEIANQIVGSLTFTIPEYRELAHTFGSHLRDKAMILETLTLLDRKTDAFTIVKELSEALSDQNRWMSTQTTAYCLIASSKFIGLEGRSEAIEFTYQVNDGKKIDASTTLPVAQVDLSIKGADKGKLSLTNSSGGTLYARVVMEGTPLQGDQSEAENGLRLDIIYKNENGDLLTPEKIEQGTDFMVELTVANPGLRGDYEQLALTQIFPSGWEIYNTRMDETGDIYLKDKPQYQDIRDDRVYTYFDLKANHRKTFRIKLNATYAGRYYLPTISCEAMYDNSISAHKPGQWVEVVKVDEQVP